MTTRPQPHAVVGHSGEPGYTMVMFKADEVPAGTHVFLEPPSRQPMTGPQLHQLLQELGEKEMPSRGWRAALVRAVERHHGITAETGIAPAAASARAGDGKSDEAERHAFEEAAFAAGFSRNVDTKELYDSQGLRTARSFWMQGVAWARAAAPAVQRQAEPVAVLETPDGVIDLRAIAEQAGISMDCWEMGSGSLAHSEGVHGVTRQHLEKFAALYGFACWNAALAANPPNMHGFVSRALAAAPAVSAPAGWKLVPIEPTPEMVQAGFGQIDYGTTVHADIERAWSCMLDATPAFQAPVTAQGEQL